jgi:PKD repeat protein
LRELVAALALLLVSMEAMAVLPVRPTTTLASETGNNTSAANTFAKQSNGNHGAANVSKVAIRNLLYSGATTKIYAHFMPWFGPSNHMNVGYDSSEPAQVKRQVEDMISRGIEGAIVDWYGPGNTHHNTTTINLMHESELHAGFEFAICEDGGAIKNATDKTQKLIDDLNYVYSTFEPSPAYMRKDGRPVIFFFGVEAYSIDWNRVRAEVLGNPLFIFRNSGGFTKPQSNGGYAWLAPQTDPPANYMSLGYLDSFYNTALKYPQLETFGSAFKGFDDSLAAWGKKRKILQFCGQTWLSSMAEAAKYYDSSKQLESLQIVTWNDYEEGTELETGIDNCFTISSSINGSILSWRITGNENTVDHYTVFVSLDAENLMPLSDVATGNYSLDLASFDLGPANYTLYVKAMGKPSMINHLSNSVGYNVPNKPPVAVLSVTPSIGPTPLGVTASTEDSSDPDGTVVSSTIDFGDGTTAPGPVATHTYTSSGTYTVTATVNDDLGASSKDNKNVKTAPRKVTISKPANNAIVNAPVQIVATASTPYTLNSLQLYIDGVLNYEQKSPDLDRTMDMAPGAHEIAVKGWDQDGPFMKKINITVNHPPTAKLDVSPSSGARPVKVTASTAGSSDPDGNIASTVVDFGDGSSTSVEPGGSASHTYSTPGTYTVTSTVTDNEGETDTATSSVKVLAPYIVITTPVDGGTYSSPVHVVANAVSGNPIGAMKVYVDDVEKYHINDSKLDTWIKMKVGTRHLVVQAWETSGTLIKKSIYITVK